MITKFSAKSQNLLNVVLKQRDGGSDVPSKLFKSSFRQIEVGLEGPHVRDEICEDGEWHD